MRLRNPSLLLALVLVAPVAARAQDGSPWGETVTGTREAPPAEPKPAPAAEKPAATTPAEAPPEELKLAPAGTAVSKVELTLDPATSPPGGVVLVTVVFHAADGKAIPGVKFDLLGKGGEVGEVAENGGRFTAAFQVSPYAEDEAKISVVTESGMMEMAKVTVAGDPVAAEPPPADAVADGPATEKPPKTPKEKKPKEASTFEPLWLHVAANGAGGLYSYAQTPDADDSGPLIEDELAFGGDAGGPARAAGAEFAATAWLPDLPYLGFQGHFRFLGYAVESPAFSDPAADTLLDVGVFVAGRYPIEIPNGQVWAGGRLGFQYDDFMSFQGCLDPGCTVDFATIATPGLGVGPRGGLEVGRLLAEVGYTAGLARFSQPYRNAVDVDLGVVLVGPLTAEARFDLIGRQIDLASKDSGDVRGGIDDQQLVGGLGLGAVL